jgi:hypothetical protein
MKSKEVKTGWSNLNSQVWQNLSWKARLKMASSDNDDDDDGGGGGDGETEYKL